jgi:hypothetical protein
MSHEYWDACLFVLQTASVILYSLILNYWIEIKLIESVQVIVGLFMSNFFISVQMDTD